MTRTPDRSTSLTGKSVPDRTWHRGDGDLMSFTYADIAKMFDHALLQPTLTAAELEAGCSMALAYDIASVCIVPFAVKRCREILSGSTVKTCTVIGFPLGGNTTAIKRAESSQALADGGQELDMVVNISKVLSGDWGYVRDEIGDVIEIAHAAEASVKVIFENCYLQDDHKIRLCRMCGELGADWIKTSTGFGTGGATIEDLRLMRAHAPTGVQIKAAGGVKNLETVLQVRALGVSRIGASGTQAVLDECRRRLELAPIDAGDAAKTDGY